jgi:hypothetical protein
MNDPEDFNIEESGHPAQNGGQTHSRAFGSPLPIGNGGRAPLSPEEDDMLSFRQPPPLGRALINSSAAASAAQQASTMDRAMGILRMALPFVHRILPLLDGNIGTAVSNLLTPHPQPPPQHQPVDLQPIEHSLADLQSQHRDLRNVVVEQNSSLKRVEDQLEMVREATDRNTLEQQELLEDLKNIGNKMNAFAFFALGLLAVSILLNVILYLHIQRVLP